MRIALALPLALAAVFPASALADTVLPSSFVSIQLLDGSTRTQYFNNTAPPSTHSLSVTSPNATLSGTYALGTDPSLSASLTYSGAPDSTAFNAGTQVNYEFSVSGPSGMMVSLDIAGYESAAVSSYVTGGFGAQSSVSISLPGSSSYLVNERVSSSGPGYTISNAKTFDDTYSVQTNTAYDVNLQTGTYFYALRPTGEYTANAVVDPTITLDTTDPAYSLQFSPGLLGPGTAATPEPCSLVLAGTGLTAALLRRRYTTPTQSHN